MLQKRLQERIDRKKAALDALRPLPKAALQRLQEEILVEWTYHSNAIEGNTLTLQETRLILETGLTIGGKSLCEHFEVTNHRSAIHFVQSLVDEAQARRLFLCAKSINWSSPKSTTPTRGNIAICLYVSPVLPIRRPMPGRLNV